MVSVLNDNLGELTRLCRQHRVKRLAVFGSAVRSDFDAESSMGARYGVTELFTLTA